MSWARKVALSAGTLSELIQGASPYPFVGAVSAPLGTAPEIALPTVSRVTRGERPERSATDGKRGGFCIVHEPGLSFTMRREHGAPFPAGGFLKEKAPLGAQAFDYSPSGLDV